MQALIYKVFEKLKSLLLTLNTNTQEEFSRAVAPHIDFVLQIITASNKQMRDDLTQVARNNQFLDDTVTSQALVIRGLNETATSQALVLAALMERLANLERSMPAPRTSDANVEL